MVCIPVEDAVHNGRVIDGDVQPNSRALVALEFAVVDGHTPGSSELDSTGHWCGIEMLDIVVAGNDVCQLDVVSCGDVNAQHSVSEHSQILGGDVGGSDAEAGRGVICHCDILDDNARLLERDCAD